MSGAKTCQNRTVTPTYVGSFDPARSSAAGLSCSPLNGTRRPWLLSWAVVIVLGLTAGTSSANAAVIVPDLAGVDSSAPIPADELASAAGMTVSRPVDPSQTVAEDDSPLKRLFESGSLNVQFAKGSGDSTGAGSSQSHRSPGSAGSALLVGQVQVSLALAPGSPVVPEVVCLPNPIGSRLKRPPRWIV